MASNEIIVRIVVDCAAFTIGFITTILAFKFALARSAAAHKREIAAKNAEIAELRECLKEAMSASRIDCGICNRDCKMKMSFADRTIHNCERIIQWRKALEGVKDEGK